jgi:hypothetical protein
MMTLLNPIDRDALREKIRPSLPFPHFCIDNSLNPDFAEEIYRSFPSINEAKAIGREFATVNEKKKIQITDSAKFAPSIARLNDLLWHRRLNILIYFNKDKSKSLIGK